MSKTIILTVDYELFLGNKTGSVQDCMIDPTEQLYSILNKNNSKMTVFWDILHYYRLLELEEMYPELKADRMIIEKQILTLAQSGHDIQLHLHPHWLDAEYESGKWYFIYERFKLDDLSSENIPVDINTVTGCFAVTKKLMENLISKVVENYKVTTFRAGGYLIEPFHEIRQAFINNQIKIDSSVCPGLFNNGQISPYDFRQYPKENKYSFKRSPKNKSVGGPFIEIPITTFKISGIVNTYFRLVKKSKYPFLEKDRKGKSISDIYQVKKSSRLVDLFTTLFKTQIVQFTTDSSYREKFNYLFKKAPDYSNMILHPKLLNKHTLYLLDEYISENKVRFISIQNYLT